MMTTRYGGAFMRSAVSWCCVTSNSNTGKRTEDVMAHAELRSCFWGVSVTGADVLIVVVGRLVVLLFATLSSVRQATIN